nr:fibronectin type III domain-containing protein [Lysobacter sp. CAU 1642]
MGANVGGIDVSCTPNDYSIGGNVSGLAAGTQVTLRNSYAPADPCVPQPSGSDKLCKVSAPGTEDLVVSANGGFSFTTALNIGDSYSVDVAPGGQPSSPNQTCTVTGGSIDKQQGKAATGQVSTFNVSNIQVTCTTESYTVGGSVVGLAAGNSVVLQNNGGDNLTVAADGPFTFATALADGSNYTVTVLTQPTTPNQTCEISRLTPGKGSGVNSGVIAGANVVDLRVTCTTNRYTVGVEVSGLVGSGLVLRNNGGDDLAITGNGPATFATSLADGSGYSVSVATQPGNPAQTCSLPQPVKTAKGTVLGSGTINGANVTGIPVTCVTDPTAPGAPTNVQVGFNGGMATVSWTPPANDGGTPITGYTVVLQPGGLGCTVSGNPPPTSCQISGIQPGTAYTAIVTASNGAGSGAPGSGAGSPVAATPAVIPVDQPWALALLGLMFALVGGRVLVGRR